MQKFKDLIYYNRKEIITVLICSIIFGSILFFNNQNNSYEIVEDKDITIEKDKEEISNTVVVDIKGEVKNPGTYEFSNNERISDAIAKAGGLTDKGDTSLINLSEKLTDEMLIIVPSIIDEDTKNDNIVSNNTNSGNTVTTNSNTTKSSNNSSKDNKISINNASVDELMTIKGIGEVKAKSIVEYRNKYGLFKSIEDITKVSGIGSSTFEKIKDYIKV